MFGIVAAFAVTWLSDIVSTFEHLPGYPGQARALRFLSIADLGWAVALLLAALLLAVGPRLLSPPGSGPPAFGRRVHRARQAVVAASSVVVVSAAISLILNLTLAGHGINVAVTGSIADLAIGVLGAAAGLWAWRGTSAGPPG